MEVFYCLFRCGGRYKKLIYHSDLQNLESVGIEIRINYYLGFQVYRLVVDRRKLIMHLALTMLNQ